LTAPGRSFQAIIRRRFRERNGCVAKGDQIRLHGNRTAADGVGVSLGATIIGRSREDAMNDHDGMFQQQRQQPPQQQQQQQQKGAGGRSQSQQQGGTPPEKTPRTTADPAADGQTVYDLQDEELRRSRGEVEAPEDRARHTPPDSNAM
jgi:hypothetical protein